MNRRQMLRLLGSIGAVGTISLRPDRARGQTLPRYTVQGSGPTVLAFDREPAGYYEALADQYRVVVLDYPSSDMSQAFIESFTADRVSSDILAVADAVGASRFAWYGYSWGAVAGLQLAIRTDRLTALVCGGWPPLGGQYRETLAVSEGGSSQLFANYYRSLADWSERDAISRLRGPRFVFAGSEDQFDVGGYDLRIGPLVAEHRAELEQMDWTVRLVDGFGHELGARPDVVIPLLREFLDPVLLHPFG